MGKKKKQVGEIGEDGKVGDSSPRAYDNDTMVFISMSQELKNEGNKQAFYYNQADQLHT